MRNKIEIPDGASAILDKLHAAGYEAYVVGGCVRDSLLGREPKDWDICTSATPAEVETLFADHDVIETGMKRGTVTVLERNVPYEVTTFRKDGDYSDGRHPDSVEFVSNIAEDLARRDFTVNAMAYSKEAGLIDPYGGLRDLERKVISCVGSPDERFGEDALRLLRAIRFAANHSFIIAPETEASIHRNVGLLMNVSAERIASELCKTLLGDGVLQMLLEYKDVFCAIIPELSFCVGFEQNNRFHQYTVYDHIAHAVANYTGKDVTVKLTLLLHDIGKPACYTEDERGGHFYGHADVSSQLSECALRRLRFDNQTVHDVAELIGVHDAVLDPTKRVVCRMLHKIGPEQFGRLLKIRLADIMAHAEGTQESRLRRLYDLGIIFKEVVEQEDCFSVKDLAINGDDVMSLGIPEGKMVGALLNDCLIAVMNEEIANNHDDLMEFLKERMTDGA